MKTEILFILILFMGFFACEAYAVDEAAIFSHKPGIWAIEWKGTLARWIVIHNLAEAKDTGVFHIEVIGHEKGRPSWDIKRICSHMALTKDALKRSVTKPLNKGSVYPEAGQKVVCDRSVLECLPAK